MSSRESFLLVGLLVLLLVSAACSEAPSPTQAPTVPDVPEATSTAETDPTESSPIETSVLPTPTEERPLAARVNGEPIYFDEYELELERYASALEAQGIDPSSEQGQERIDQARGWILDMMIEQVLTAQAAEEAGVEVTDAQVEQSLQEMAAESGGEEAFRAKLEEWGETYEHAKRQVRAQLIGMAMTDRVVAQVPESTEQVRARHILVDTREEAEHIRSQLEAGADFTALAREHSLDKGTRDNGGDLGYFPRGILVASEVEDVAFSLQPGELSDVIASPMGFHIVQVTERDPDRAIGAENQQMLREQAVQEWVESLWSDAKIERFVGVTE